MGRLRNLLHAHYPGLIEDLFSAGVWELPFADTIHPAARRSYKAEKSDVDLTPLCARRTTLEMVMRRYVERERIASFRCDTAVLKLLIDEAGPPVCVRGVEAQSGNTTEETTADIVIDASGRGSKFADELRTYGAHIEEEHYPSGNIYYTRHYKLNPGCQFPVMAGLPAAEFADFTIGALPADNNTFTVTLSVWKDDPILFEAARQSDFFDRICEAVPRVNDWTKKEIATPVSDVIGFGNMDCFWRKAVHDNAPQVHNFFFVGDSAVRTNPKFGRGCTWSTVAAHDLAKVLSDEADPSTRSIKYETALWREFRQDWKTTLTLERNARKKFEAELGQRKANAWQRLVGGIEAHVMTRAMVIDAQVQRAIMRGFHGLSGMSAWSRNPLVWKRILQAYFTTAENRKITQRYATRPNRSELQLMAATNQKGNAK